MVLSVRVKPDDKNEQWRCWCNVMHSDVSLCMISHKQLMTSTDITVHFSIGLLLKLYRLPLQC